MEKFCGEIGGNENPSRIVLEVELPEQARYNEEIADQCKTLFIRIVRRFYAAASVKEIEDEKTTPVIRRALIMSANGSLCLNEKVVKERWPSEYHHSFLIRCMSVILQRLDEPQLNAFSLAADMNLSKASLYRKIKLLTNQSIHDFTRMVKMQAAYQLLSTQEFSVAEVAWQCGYSSVRHFSKLFFQVYQTLPSKMRR
jgi:transcriptional regulator GlxA family with amidase domain